MALTWGDLNGKLQDKIIPTVADVIYKSSPVFIRIRTNNGQQFDGGNYIRQNIGYAELNGGPFGRGQTFRLISLGLTVLKDTGRQFPLIDSDAENANEAEGASHRERPSGETSFMDDAMVRSHRNMNYERPAEMTGPLPLAA